jgi:hypothetical protein
VSAESFKWEKFLGELADAVQGKQPTLFLAEHVNSVTTTYPDLFYALPQLRPSEPLVSAACRCVYERSSKGLLLLWWVPQIHLMPCHRFN